MSGNLPDGVSQADIDRALDGGDEPHTGHMLEEDFDNLEAQVERTCDTIDDLRSIKAELTEALRESMLFYCVGCGYGAEGCATIHHRDCRMLALLERAEGRKLKLNGEPEDEN